MSAVRNFVTTLLISLLIFGLVAFGILQFADGALFGRGGNSGNGGSGNGGHVTTTTPDLPPPPEGFDAIKGKSMTVLFIGTDFCSCLAEIVERSALAGRSHKRDDRKDNKRSEKDIRNIRQPG